MKIIYADDKLKELCKNRFTEMDIEKILKCFSDILGKKITVLDSSFNEKTYTLKTKNMDNNIINEINIEVLYKEHVLKVPNTTNYLISIGEENKESSLKMSNSFIVNKYCVQKVSDNIYNKENNLMLKGDVSFANKIRYTITKDNIRCSFLLDDPTKSIMLPFSQIENLSLSNVYNLLKSLNEDFVLDITINLSNKKVNEFEEVVIQNGNLVLYEKKCIKDNKVINLIYRNGEVYANVSQTLNNDKLVIDAIDVTEDIEKVKKLVNK